MDLDDDDDHDDAPDAKIEALAEQDRKFAEGYLEKISALNGYPESFSLFAGEMLKLRLARKPKLLLIPRKAFLRDIEMRDAVSGKTVARFKPDRKILIAEQTPAGYRDDGAAYSAKVEIDTTGWPPGVLECVVRDSVGGTSNSIFVNIKPASFDGYDLVCVLPFFTWHAYSLSGGHSFYSRSHKGLRTISTQRPLHRLGANAMDGSLAFLETFTQGGVKWACVDSMDLHSGALPEGRAPVMALLTHDEYWSWDMRSQINRYLRRGGVLMVAAGNVCWWLIDVEGHNLTVNKGDKPDTAYWWLKGFPEEKTFLSSFRFGGYSLKYARRKPALSRYMAKMSAEEIEAAGALTVVQPNHPLFQGVVLGPGNTFGAEVPIVYCEVDAVPLKIDGSVDRSLFEADDIEPEIIATGLTVSNRRHRAIERVGVVVEADVRRGHVLHMGSFGWSRGLARKNEAVKRIVLNAYHHCRSFARERKRRGREEED
jgi:hypothetical protein